ncbi:PLC-like phosphodiesterase [Parathielavia hyrcaniae]|uniref:PLC-like phosphodiesterase n=1 Tax=Parathielavia hyrcaniae TaxID=113614 RepID=A0AAN6T462_9PEZI|nr:PLC-like phosphodiesterase [Parathielavia hyrcaniae]
MSPEETPLLPGAIPHRAEGTAPIPGISPRASASRSGPMSGPARLPFNIGHRGYKAMFPENSMAAFHGALEAGAHALETDLHLSRDGVVVLSHDATLKRCFGVDAKVADCDWAYLSTLRTLRGEPRQGMPRLADLLAWLAGLDRPGPADADDAPVWLLLDVKTDDDPERLLPAVAHAIASVPCGGGGGDGSGGGKGWKERIVVGCWNENYINHARLHLPGHPLVYIGFSLLYARRFLSDDHADVHFNLLQPTLVGPVGAHFRREARRRGRKLFVWTVNDEGWMEWCIRKAVDGVITDEVGRFAEVRGRFEDADVGGGEAGGDGVRWPRMLRLYCSAILLQAVVAVVSLLLWHRLSRMGSGGKGRKAKAGLVPGTP